MRTRITSRHYPLVLLAAVLALTVGCADGGPTADPLGGRLVEPPPARSETSLDERISAADVIARVRLQSVAVGSARWRDGVGAPITRHSTLEHRFEVLEYLKGTAPGTEIVGVVFDWAKHETESDAVAGGNELRTARDGRWDEREAVVFLHADAHLLLDFPQAGRYILGEIRSTHGPYYSDHYSIASGYDKRWLPSASSGGATGASSERRYLLDVPTAGASGQSGTAPTVSLTELKAAITAIEGEAAASGGSDTYRDCLAEKYRLERKVDAYEGPGDYFYLRFDEAIGSGQPAGTLVHWFLQEPVPELSQLPPDWGEHRIIGRDSALFAVDGRGAHTTVRPLPAGEYRFNPFTIGSDQIPCDAIPEKEQKRLETFVTVTAPTGTAHEAFFDPVAIGTGFGADGTNGALKPKAFTVGGSSASLSSLTWQGGSVVLTLSPYAALTGQTLDVLAVDGALTLSLAASAATVDATAGTLTWSVASQPWQAGDLLMLRLRSGAASPTATP